MIGRELCPGLFFSDREEKDPPGALPVELEKLSRSESTGAGEIVRDSPRGKQDGTPHGENRKGSR